MLTLDKYYMYMVRIKVNILDRQKNDPKAAYLGKYFCMS